MDYELSFKALKYVLDTTPFNINLFCSCGKHQEVVVQETKTSVRVGLLCSDCENIFYLSESDKRFFKEVI